MAEIAPGAQVNVRTADNRVVARRAVTGIERGYDFLVVWVCQEEEWEAAQSESRSPDGVPWPAEDVQLVG